MDDDFVQGFIWGGTCVLTVVILVFFIVSTVSYKNGQVDAINGEIHYQLERQQDGTTIWVFCEEVCRGS